MIQYLIEQWYNKPLESSPLEHMTKINNNSESEFAK